MNKSNTRKLGLSDIEVTVIGMGCWAIGGPFWEGKDAVGWSKINDAKSIRAIHRALDLGDGRISLPDTRRRRLREENHTDRPAPSARWRGRWRWLRLGDQRPRRNTISPQREDGTPDRVDPDLLSPHLRVALPARGRRRRGLGLGPERQHRNRHEDRPGPGGRLEHNPDRNRARTRTTRRRSRCSSAKRSRRQSTRSTTLERRSRKLV